MITVSTDGSCLRNPGGAIGWAWANHDGTHASGGAASGTNQVAELTAVLEAIHAHPGDEPLRIEADSQYAIKCASEWVHGWKRKGWRTASGGPVQNLGLVQAIDRAIAERPGPVAFAWVRGHRGDRFNERADELAGIAAREARDGRPSSAQSAVPPNALGGAGRAAEAYAPAAAAPAAEAYAPAAAAPAGTVPDDRPTARTARATRPAATATTRTVPTTRPAPEVVADTLF